MRPSAERTGARRRRWFHAVGILLIARVLAATAVLAAFSSTATGSQTVSTGTLAAPSSLSATNGACVVSTSTKVNLAWTQTSSTFADGYQIFRSTTNGGPYTSVATVSGILTTAYTDSVAFSTTYYYVVQAKRNGWRSPNSVQAQVRTPSVLCVL